MWSRLCLVSLLTRSAGALSLCLSACNAPSTIQADMVVPDLAAVAPPSDLLGEVADMIRPRFPDDGPVPGNNGVVCFDGQGGSTNCGHNMPFCCYRSGTGTCTANLDGCPFWIGCRHNSDCPGDYPLCCTDNKPNRDCRSSCMVSLCSTDEECPRDHPRCVEGVTLEDPWTCQ